MSPGRSGHQPGAGPASQLPPARSPGAGGTVPDRPLPSQRGDSWRVPAAGTGCQPPGGARYSLWDQKSEFKKQPAWKRPAAAAGRAARPFEPVPAVPCPRPCQELSQRRRDRRTDGQPQRLCRRGGGGKAVLSPGAAGRGTMAGCAHSWFGLPIPGLDLPIPGLGLPIPGFGVPIPGFGVPIPGFGLPIPGFGLAIPGFGLPIPRFGVPIPGLGLPIPGLDLPIPGFGLPIPGFGVPIPGLGLPIPGFGVPIPGLGLPIPRFGVPIPGFGVPIPGFGVPIPGFGLPIPGFGLPIPGFGVPIPGLGFAHSRVCIPGLGLPTPGFVHSRVFHS
uniref:Uncharacterized protein n=1 Tax=Taeniopygia guttata TaxID=59729 RepID=A0A674HFX2_TAEGU